MKAFIIGHHEKAKGAFSTILNTTEWDLFKSMESELSKLGDVYTHNPNISSYTQRVQETANRINQKNYTMVVALHFNMFNGVANGCEALFVSDKGRQLAVNFCTHYTKLTGANNRGAKQLSSGQNGYGEIFNPKATAILIEPFFGDNARDCQLFTKEKLIESLKCL